MKLGKLTVIVVLVALATGFEGRAMADLLVHYNFDEPAGGTTNAINSGTLGSSADGVFNGTATRVNNTPNGTLAAMSVVNSGVANTNNNFVGTSGDVNGLDQLSNMTITMWINIQGNPGVGFYALATDQQLGVGTPGWQFYYAPVGGDATNMQLHWDVNTSDVGATTNISSNDTWVFVAVTYAGGAGGAVNFYGGDDVTPVASLGSAGFTAVPGTNTVGLRIGANVPFGNDRSPDAFMDDVRIFNETLTQAQLETIREEIPEPASLSLLAIGGLMVLSRRRAGAR